MADVQVTVAGRSYRLACADGDEPALRQAARELDTRASALLEALGTETEARLLLMTALQLVGEQKDEAAVAEGPPLLAQLESLAQITEALASRLEQAAGLAPATATP
ncbi:MAG: cell division protein ZapA [Sphingomonadaceae bacterium]